MLSWLKRVLSGDETPVQSTHKGPYRFAKRNEAVAPVVLQSKVEAKPLNIVVDDVRVEKPAAIDASMQPVKPERDPYDSWVLCSGFVNPSGMPVPSFHGGFVTVSGELCRFNPASHRYEPWDMQTGCFVTNAPANHSHLTIKW